MENKYPEYLGESLEPKQQVRRNEKAFVNRRDLLRHYTVCVYTSCIVQVCVSNRCLLCQMHLLATFYPGTFVLSPTQPTLPPTHLLPSTTHHLPTPTHSLPTHYPPPTPPFQQGPRINVRGLCILRRRDVYVESTWRRV